MRGGKERGILRNYFPLGELILILFEERQLPSAASTDLIRSATARISSVAERA